MIFKVIKSVYTAGWYGKEQRPDGRPVGTLLKRGQSGNQAGRPSDDAFIEAFNGRVVHNAASRFNAGEIPK
jgi:hypothetical protein